jgi:hypothetical protein
MHSLIQRYSQTQALHFNCNIIAASLSGTAAAIGVASLCGALGASPGVISTASTVTNVAVFVPVHLGLHWLVVCLQAKARRERVERVRYWAEVRLIYATGALAIAAFLALFAAGQVLLLRFGVAPVPATLTAYVCAQLVGRLIHTGLVRLTGRSPRRVSP